MCLAPEWRAPFPHRIVIGIASSKSDSNASAFNTFDALFRHLNFQKWSETGVFCTFGTSPHNGVHFFDIATSKSGLKPVYFDTFYFQMCFAPQRCALFQHLNFQKSPEHGVFCTFSLPNVLRATTVCTFSTSQLPKVLQCRQFLPLFTSKCASRHNDVQFLMSHLPTCLRTRCFSEPTFRPSGGTKHWKTRCFATFLPFRAPASSLF